MSNIYPNCTCLQCGEYQLTENPSLPVDYGHGSEVSDSKQVNMVDHPPHYTNHPSGIECIEITRYMCFNLGNVIKYLWRCEEKENYLEDLKKAAWYLNDEIKTIEKQ
jgi:hypothetical protein